MKKKDQRRAWEAMLKFADEKPLTESEWSALSRITLIDRNRLEFAPGNCRWATTDTERADNLAFYRSLGASTRTLIERRPGANARTGRRPP
jgi:hypothetical protein